MENLADFYDSHGSGDKGRPLYESALKIARQLVGTDYDYQALPHMNRLVRAYRATGDNKSAADLLKKIIQTEKSVLGPHHPQVALDLMQLAEIESALGQKGKAKNDRKEALSDLELFFPPDHPLVLQAKELLEESSKK